MTYRTETDMHLVQDATSVTLTLTTSKDCSDAAIGELLWRISEAFAKTEGVAVAVMHVELERQVQAFEGASRLKFVWMRDFVDPHYPERLREHLRKVRRTRSLH